MGNTPLLPPPLPSLGALLSSGAGTFLVWRAASPLPWFAEQSDAGFKDACVEEAAVERRTPRAGGELPLTDKTDRESRWAHRDLTLYSKPALLKLLKKKLRQLNRD